MKPQVLKGFRDYLPEDMLARTRLIAQIREVFEAYGFSPIDTPALEYAELLLGKYGAEGDKLLFRFLDNGERDVALRYDLTVPLARLLGANPQVLLPFKRYHIAPVWRAEKPARGRFREFMQCDVDIVGIKEMSADAEVICVGISALRRLLVKHAPGFTVRLSNRKLLNGLCEKLGLDNPIGVFRTLDKLDKQGADAVKGLLKSECGLNDRQVADTFAYLECPVTPADFSKLRAYFGDIAIGHQGIAEVEQVVKHVGEQGFGEHLAINLSIARGLDYYTGSIYETSLNGLDGFGSVMSGGRYDKLLDMFMDHDTPAVGISVGLDRLLAGLAELKLIEERSSPTQVLVTVFSPELRAQATQIAGTVRACGVSTELFLADDKLGKQFRYADRKRIPYTVVCGPDEAAKGVVKVKTMQSGDEQTLDTAGLERWAKSLHSN